MGHSKAGSESCSVLGWQSHCELTDPHVITPELVLPGPALSPGKEISDNRLLFSALALTSPTMPMFFVRHTKAQTMGDNERAVPLISLSNCSTGTGSLSLFTSLHLTTH
jgi:hypothetical protein